jgi:hypothetical protein
MMQFINQVLCMCYLFLFVSYDYADIDRNPKKNI